MPLSWLQWLIGRLAWAGANVVAALDALVPSVPASLAGVCGRIQGLGTWIAPVSAWLPFGDLVAAVAIWLAGLLAGVTIKLIRVGASFATLGGGSAG